MTPRDDEVEVPSPIEMKGGPEALRPFIGQWVAIVNGEVRAHGASGKAVSEEADRLGLDALFYFVPPAPYVGHASGR